MSKAKDHAIGERFMIDHIIYEVRQADACAQCSLWVEDEGECLDTTGRFGSCARNARSDRKEVVFVQVGEVTD